MGEGVGVIKVDSDFARSVMADGTVSRDELDQGLARFFECLSDAGGTGEYWVQPDLGLTWPALNLSTPNDVDPDVFKSKCEGAYLGPIESYQVTHPPTAAQEERMVELATTCLESESPTLSAEAPPGADYGALRMWAAQVPPDGSNMQILERCVIYLGIPYKPLPGQ